MCVCMCMCVCDTCMCMPVSVLFACLCLCMHVHIHIWHLHTYSHNFIERIFKSICFEWSENSPLALLANCSPYFLYSKDMQGAWSAALFKYWVHSWHVIKLSNFVYASRSGLCMNYSSSVILLPRDSTWPARFSHRSTHLTMAQLHFPVILTIINNQVLSMNERPLLTRVLFCSWNVSGISSVDKIF